MSLILTIKKIKIWETKFAQRIIGRLNLHSVN